MVTTLLISALASALIAVIGWTGKQISDKLEKISDSVNDIKVELSTLVTDHENVKDDIKELKVRLYDLEHN